MDGSLTPACGTCSGLGWVCECHPGRPWGGTCCEELPGPRLRRLFKSLPWPQSWRWRLWEARWLQVRCEHGACHCGGAGMACRSCNPDGGLEWLHVEAEAT
jgi:hypothetical protein